MAYICNGIFFSLKRQEILSHATTWMNPEDIILNEVSQPQKTILYDSSYMMYLLLLLSCFSCVRLFVTPWTAAYQAPPPTGFSRQEYWSGVPLLSPYDVSAAAKSLQSCPTLCDPIDGSPPGSPVPGILQARVLECGAIAFSI